MTYEDYLESRRRLFARDDGDEDKSGIKFWMMAMLAFEVEECAKIADLYVEKAWSATDIAADIRARGQS